MKYSIYCVKDSKLNEELKSSIRSILSKKGYEIDNIHPDLVITLGGDGTFLRAIHHYKDINPLFLPINTGKLGFLCSIDAKDTNKNSYYSINGLSIKEYRLIEVKCDNNNAIYALNEVRIECPLPNCTKFPIYINDDLLEVINADGVCISSSLGSSGIARGLNGALIDSELEVLQLIEKLPINNHYYKSINSPMIFSGKNTIYLKDLNKKDLILIADFYTTKINVDKISIGLTKDKIRVLTLPNSNFTKKLKGGFYD